MTVPRIDVDPSRPVQRAGWLFAFWLPRGRGRDDRARGLLCALSVCTNPACDCTEAKVTAIPVDDRLRWAKLHEGHVTTKWWEAHHPMESYPLTLDFVTGEVTNARGEELPAVVRPFFEAPIPAWTLDDVYAEWAAQRPAPETAWHEAALERWRPGDMLSLLDADPTRRPDTYVRDGRSYIVDFCFCVAPGCTCKENRFVVLAVEKTEEETLWSQIGSFELGPGLTPRAFDGTREHTSTATSIYLDWRARSGNPEARFEDLRARVRARGTTLLEMAQSRARELPSPRARAPVVPTAAAPGRNAPCPCGSGKKFKRCCGRADAARA